LLGADLVITGEGHLDAQSFEGKVVGGVQRLAADLGIVTGAVVGDVDDDVRERMPHRSLVAMFGLESAMAEPMRCIEAAATELLGELLPKP
jgi:glycerate 2-kinase